MKNRYLYQCPMVHLSMNDRLVGHILQCTFENSSLKGVRNIKGDFSVSHKQCRMAAAALNDIIALDVGGTRWAR